MKNSRLLGFLMTYYFKIICVGDKKFPQSDYQLIETLKELQNVYDYTNSTRIGFYGGYQDLNPQMGDVRFDQDSWSKVGESNTESGFIIYEIPDAVSPQDLSVWGGFGNFGTAIWRLA